MNLTKVLGIGAFALALATFASCSSDEPANNNATINNGSLLVKAPKVTAWSGEEVFGSTTKTRAAEGDVPAAITQEEIDAAKAYFNAKDNWLPTTGGKDLEIEDLSNWSAFYVQKVAEGNKLPLEVAQYVGTNNEVISNIAVWDLDADEVLKLLNTDAYLTHESKTDVDPTSNQLVVSGIKDISFETTGYDINNTLYENVRSAGHKGQYDFRANYYIMSLDGADDAVYVALYGYTNQNNGYWDYIIKLTKAEVADEPEIETPEEGENVTEGNILHNNEVEVNLSVLDLHETNSVEDLATKLSIHVRCAKDVKVRIPVPVETLVPADDLAIVLDRKELLESYGEEHRVSFDINGHNVELTVDFVEATDCAGNGYGYYIEVTTKGINKDVLDYCFENNGDGINFEVWNYYQWNVTDEEGNAKRVKPTTEEISDLQHNWLDSSTIEFGYDNGTWNAYTNMSDYPYYYINAFNDTEGRDCYVHVISNQAYAFDNVLENMPHLNGSNLNLIYVREDIFGTDLQDDAHTPHFEELPPVPVY